MEASKLGAAVFAIVTLGIFLFALFACAISVGFIR